MEQRSSELERIMVRCFAVLSFLRVLTCRMKQSKASNGTVRAADPGPDAARLALAESWSPCPIGALPRGYSRLQSLCLACSTAAR